MFLSPAVVPSDGRPVGYSTHGKAIRATEIPLGPNNLLLVTMLDLDLAIIIATRMAITGSMPMVTAVISASLATLMGLD